MTDRLLTRHQVEARTAAFPHEYLPKDARGFLPGAVADRRSRRALARKRNRGIHRVATARDRRRSPRRGLTLEMKEARRRPGFGCQSARWTNICGVDE